MPLARETDAQLRARHDRKFIEELYALCNSMHDLSDPVLSWVGDRIGKLADRAAFLGARSPEDFDDRESAMLESVYDRRYDEYNDAREAAHNAREGV